MFQLVPGVAGVIEVFGSLLLLLGLFTRPVAFIMSGEMAIAYFYAHQPRNFFPLLNGGDSAILYCFIFFYFFVAGGGAGASTDCCRVAGEADSEHSQRSQPLLSSPCS